MRRTRSCRTLKSSFVVSGILTPNVLTCPFVFVTNEEALAPSLHPGGELNVYTLCWMSVVASRSPSRLGEEDPLRSLTFVSFVMHESCNHSLVRILGCMPTLNFSSSESLSCSLHGLCNMLSPGEFSSHPFEHNPNSDCRLSFLSSSFIIKNLSSLCFRCSAKVCLFKFPVTTFSESAYNLGIHFEIKKSSSSCRCVMKSSRHVAPSTSPIHSRAPRGCLKHSAAAGDFVKNKFSTNGSTTQSANCPTRPAPLHSCSEFQPLMVLSEERLGFANFCLL